MKDVCSSQLSLQNSAITGFAPATAPLAQVVTNVIDIVTGTDYVAPGEFA